MKSISIFKNISDTDIEKMLVCFNAKKIYYKKDATIMSFLGNTSTIGIILEGSADLIRNDYYGNRTILDTIGVNDIFGEVFTKYNKKELSIMAREDCLILFIDYYHITKRCKKACPYHSVLVSNTLEILSEKIVANNERIEVLSKRSTRDKLLTYFNIKSKERNSKSFTLPFSYTDLSDYLGVDRSAMSRELSNLKEDGIISTIGRKITIKY